MDVRLGSRAHYVRTTDPEAVRVMRLLGYRPKTVEGTHIYRVNWDKGGKVFEALCEAGARFWM